MDLWEEIVRIRRAGGRAVLATIVRRTGSAPRKDAAKMLIRDDGSILGSVGGGCVEGEVWQQAREVLRTGQPRLSRFELNADNAAEDGLICGGIVEIFLEPIMSDPRLVILGAGHLGQALAEIGHLVGFQVVVYDDREQYANRERFPEAQEILVGPFDSMSDRVSVDSQSFVVVVTRGHQHDLAATEQVIRTSARYVGLVGSRRKIKMIVEELLNRGHAPEVFDRLYAPIGLDIGSDTPEEIAVSVVAELIALRKGVHRR
ncbi:MAG TPA: XdhC/CoxI family protein, partial [Acidobacteriota bacterium]|nr:XdhC/CoxI family protein [Acidobacteriota bacterium]